MKSITTYIKTDVIFKYYHKNFNGILQFKPPRNVPVTGKYAIVFQERDINMLTHIFLQPTTKPDCFLVFVGLEHAYPDVIYECVVFSPTKVRFRPMSDKDITDLHQIIDSLS